MKRIMIIAISVIAAIVLLIFSINSTAAKSTQAEEPAEVPAEESAEAEPESEPDSIWHFYNTDLQNDGIVGNEEDFGPSVIATAGNQEQAEMADTELRFRISIDPALGAADMAWFDSIMGTRYLGVFYDECSQKWDQAINRARQDWMEDPEYYRVTAQAFFSFLDSATKVEIREEKGLTDQMYMNPYTPDGIPDVIVMETDDHAGTFLVYTFVIKGTTTKEVKYRLECGYQPTNVAEVMNIKPQKRGGGGGDTIQGGGQGGGTKGGGTINGGGGNKKPTPSPAPTPQPTPPPQPQPTPTPQPQPTPTPKDPSDGTVVLPNDDQGPGENTNNPDNPDHSKKEAENSSTEMSQEEYNETVQELDDANSGGGDEPSTPPPSEDTKVDNGDGGNISEPTPVQDSSVSGDKSGEAFGGPPN